MPQHPIVISLRDKVLKLIEQNTSLQNELDRVVARKDRLKEDNVELTLRITEMEKRIKHLELAQGVASGREDKKLARARVNRLMREVDACIALLSK